LKVLGGTPEIESVGKPPMGAKPSKDESFVVFVAYASRALKFCQLFLISLLKK